MCKNVLFNYNYMINHSYMLPPIRKNAYFSLIIRSYYVD